MAFQSCRSNSFRGMELNVESVIKRPFSSRNYIAKLKIVPWLYIVS